MWFRFPQGVTEISVEQQNFAIEAEENGEAFFRAPDHFAAKILDLPGFVQRAPERTDLDDLPQSDPLRDNALRQLSAQVEHLKLENGDLRASIAEQKVIIDELKLKLHEATTELSNIKHDAENPKPTKK